jgi:hypothetical protein
MAAVMSKYSIGLWDRLASLLKRLTVDSDLNDSEAGALARVTDEVNLVRDEYTDRKIVELLVAMEEHANDA